MKKWVVEDWEFELTATDGKAGHCRIGLEKGDKFVFQYASPAGICPKVIMQVYTWCFGTELSGDFAHSGLDENHEIDLQCPDNSIKFHLKAYPINRDENGKSKPNNPRPED